LGGNRSRFDRHSRCLIHIPITPTTRPASIERESYAAQCVPPSTSAKSYRVGNTLKQAVPGRGDSVCPTDAGGSGQAHEIGDLRPGGVPVDVFSAIPTVSESGTRPVIQLSIPLGNSMLCRTSPCRREQGRLVHGFRRSSVTRGDLPPFLPQSPLSPPTRPVLLITLTGRQAWSRRIPQPRSEVLW